MLVALGCIDLTSSLVLWCVCLFVCLCDFNPNFSSLIEVVFYSVLDLVFKKISGQINGTNFIKIIYWNVF